MVLQISRGRQLGEGSLVRRIENEEFNVITALNPQTKN